MSQFKSFNPRPFNFNHALAELDKEMSENDLDNLLYDEEDMSLMCRDIDMAMLNEAE